MTLGPTLETARLILRPPIHADFEPFAEMCQEPETMKFIGGTATPGKGYATEGAAAATDWAFDTLGWDSVIHCIAPDNAASIRVAERLGSYLQRSHVLMPPPNVDVYVDICGQTAAEWRARRKGVRA